VATPIEKTATLPRRIPQARGSLYTSPNAIAAMNQWQRHPIRQTILLCEAPTHAVLIRLLNGLKALP
jgi:hypothetical protein